MRNEFLVYGSPLILQDEIDEVVKVLNSGWLGSGPRVSQFERDFSHYKGSGHSVAVSSCTAALHLSLLAAGIKRGDEVITTPMTFCATVNAIIHAGGTPVLADVDPVTMNIDPVAVEAAITPRTRAIVPVHFAGHPCDMDSLVKIAQKNDLVIIEDCAHAIETMYKGVHAGTIGDYGCFSFYATKNIVTGEGGMVLCKEQSNATFVKTMALHGLSGDAWKRFSDEGYKHYDVVECGYKYNMMDIQAAIGIHQLARVGDMWLRRKKLWEMYSDLLSDLPLRLPSQVRDPDSRHAYHLYPVTLDGRSNAHRRDTVLRRMTDENIGVGVHYRSVPEHSYYQERYGWRPEAWPNAMNIGRQSISLPLSAKLTDGDLNDVVEAVKKTLN
jgi:dTDP-4-amino-4,6-dideoxygalactose transaminase